MPGNLIFLSATIPLQVCLFAVKASRSGSTGSRPCDVTTVPRVSANSIPVWLGPAERKGQWKGGDIWNSRSLEQRSHSKEVMLSCP